jgi:glycosyltransferase involved in cell wall biosynthesis
MPFYFFYPVSLHLWAPWFVKFGGGITSFSRELASSFAEGGRSLRLFGKNDAKGVFAGNPLWGAAGYPARLQSAAFAVGVVSAAVMDRPEEIVSTHLNFGPFAHLAARLRGIPFTLVAHGIDVHPNLSKARVAALRAAHRVIVVSGWTRERILALGGIEESRVVVLPNTFDEEKFCVSAPPEYLRERYHLQEGERVVLTVARLDAGEGYKGYDRVLQAVPEIVRKCGDVRFLIAGQGNDRIRLKQLVKALGISDRVTFAGFVPDEELADHYRLADVFAMPSTGEGFGIVFLEAMGCGTPVLGGNLDGSVDALAGGMLGALVDPLAVDAIAAGLVSLLEGKGPALWFQRRSLSDKVRQIYGREAFRARLLELFPLN